MSKSITLAKRKPVILSLDERDRLRVDALFEQLYWENGHLPTVEFVYEKMNHAMPLEQIQAHSETEEFKKKLLAKGIATDTISHEVLTPEQIVIANAALNIFDKANFRLTLETLGVTLTQYNSWLRDPAFQNYMKRRGEALFAGSDHVAYKALVQAAQNGDTKAATTLLEMKGKYAKNINMNLNVEAVVVKLIEIIAKHVHDPEVLEAISLEIEQLEI